jgi:hypothetical protein
MSAITKVDVSMVSLKWGDVLSTLLPGALALFALASWFPSLNEKIIGLKDIGVAGSFALLLAAGLLGGILEAFTRVVWEKYWLVRRCPSGSVLHHLRNGNCLELYERGVQGSYKYVTFYANFAWATAVLFFSRLHGGSTLCSGSSAVLLIVFFLLLVASDLQWKYYVNYLKNVFGGNENAEERPTAGDASKISARSEEGKSE